MPVQSQSSVPAQEICSSVPVQESCASAAVKEAVLACLLLKVKNVASATDDSDYFNVDIRVLNEFNQQKGLPYIHLATYIY